MDVAIEIKHNNFYKMLTQWFEELIYCILWRWFEAWIHTIQSGTVIRQ